MKLYMINYENLPLLAVSRIENKYIVPGILQNCPEQFKSIQNFLDFDGGNCKKLLELYLKMYLVCPFYSYSSSADVLSFSLKTKQKIHS